MSLVGLLAAVETVDQPVDREVGIAADGRREVAVAVAGEGVVAFFLGAVDGPLHRAEHGVVDGVLARVALHRVEQLLQLEAVFQVLDFEAELADELGEHLHLARVGAAVDAAEEDQAGVGELLGHRFVRREHELFDDLMALGVLGEVSAGDAAIGVEVDLHLGHRQFERAALEAAGAEASSPARASRPSRRSATSGVSFFFQRVARFGQVFVDFFVGEAATALDRALEDIGRDADAFFGELHHGREGVANFVRLQAGQIVGDDLRQHRDDAVGQVDAGRAVVRFAIERRLRLHEVRDIGDVDAEQPVAVVDAFERDGVVEVAGVDRVDRDDRRGR